MKKLPTVYIVCCILLVAGPVFFFGFRSLGNWLVVDQPLPQKIDVIFSFGGDDGRALYAVDLQRKYPSAIFVISCGAKTYTEQMVIRRGSDSVRTVFVDTCKTTWSEITFIGCWIERAFGDKKVAVGLVSSPYHMRRIQMMMMRRGKNNIIPYYLPVPRDEYASRCDFGKWWKTADLRNSVITEVEKMAKFLFFNWN